jgi:hypothetical protein
LEKRYTSAQYFHISIIAMVQDHCKNIKVNDLLLKYSLIVTGNKKGNSCNIYNTIAHKIINDYIYSCYYEGCPNILCTAVFVVGFIDKKT